VYSGFRSCQTPQVRPLTENLQLPRIALRGAIYTPTQCATHSMQRTVGNAQGASHIGQRTGCIAQWATHRVHCTVGNALSLIPRIWFLKYCLTHYMTCKRHHNFLHIQKFIDQFQIFSGNYYCFVIIVVLSFRNYMAFLYLFLHDSCDLLGRWLP